MFHRSKILPLVILALLASMAVIAYTIGNNDQSATETSPSSQTDRQAAVAQEEIDELKQRDSFGEAGVGSPEPDDANQNSGGGPSVSLGLYTYDSNSNLFKVGATVSGGSDIQSCLFKLSDRSLSVEIETDLLPPTQTQQGCKQAVLDASKLHKGDDWIIEVQILDADKAVLASLVENYKVQQ